MVVEADLYKQSMRRLAGGVCIVTSVTAAGSRSGFTATAVCSIAIDPPTLLVCANRADDNHDIMRASGFFAVNLLRADDQNLSDGFSSAKIGEARFSDGSWSKSPHGMPILDGAMAWFECRMAHHVVMATHGVFFGVAETVGLGQSAIDPLVYFNGAYRTLSPSKPGSDS